MPCLDSCLQCPAPSVWARRECCLHTSKGMPKGISSCHLNRRAAVSQSHSKRGYSLYHQASFKTSDRWLDAPHPRCPLRFSSSCSSLCSNLGLPRHQRANDEHPEIPRRRDSSSDSITKLLGESTPNWRFSRGFCGDRWHGSLSPAQLLAPEAWINRFVVIPLVDGCWPINS